MCNSLLLPIGTPSAADSINLPTTPSSIYDTAVKLDRVAWRIMTYHTGFFAFAELGWAWPVCDASGLQATNLTALVYDMLLFNCQHLWIFLFLFLSQTPSILNNCISIHTWTKLLYHIPSVNQYIWNAHFALDTDYLKVALLHIVCAQNVFPILYCYWNNNVLVAKVIRTFIWMICRDTFVHCAIKLFFPL